MSRIAKKSIAVPINVEILLTKKIITVQYNNKIISYNFHNSVLIKYNNSILSFISKNADNYGWMQAGTVRSIVNSMIIGVTMGFSKKLKLIGVGYRINIEKNNMIIMHLGYSHIINYVLPKNIIAKILSPTEIILTSINKQLLGQVASDLRKKKPPESYKGKGIRYENEIIKIKEAKKNNMFNFNNKKYARVRRASKLRFKMKYLNIVRLLIHRTSRHIYAQIIDSKSNNILISASTLEKNIKKFISCYTGNKKSASVVGTIIAERCIKKGIKYVSFDRSGFKYHGRIKSLAESARKSGLKF